MNCGLILAAGASARMGSPKALLPYRNATFLDRLIGLLAAHAQPVIVVLGAHAGDIRARAGCGATLVWNAEFERGQTSSMQCGLRAVPAEATGVLFTLVDHPAVSAATIAALTQPQTGGTRIRVPRYCGRRGHPIWFHRDLIAEFLALRPDQAARDVVRAHADETEFLDVDDAGIVADIDDPAAYGALVGAGL